MTTIKKFLTWALPNNLQATRPQKVEPTPDRHGGKRLFAHAAGQHSISTNRTFGRSPKAPDRTGKC